MSWHNHATDLPAPANQASLFSLTSTPSSFLLYLAVLWLQQDKATWSLLSQPCGGFLDCFFCFFFFFAPRTNTPALPRKLTPACSFLPVATAKPAFSVHLPFSHSPAPSLVSLLRKTSLLSPTPPLLRSHPFSKVTPSHCSGVPPSLCLWVHLRVCPSLPCEKR